MIKYDYVIERKTGSDQTQIFTPDKIPKELSNLVLIEGPNSLGKSTLLNIIALGLFGNKSSRINSALQEKMSALLNSDHQKIKFSFEITYELDNLVIRSRKSDLNSKEIIVEESLDGKNFTPIIYENFEKKYNLIYDIPNNPTERLPDLLKELREEQRHYGNKFMNFGNFLRDTIQQIGKTRDPKRLNEIKERLKRSQDEKKNLDDELPSLRTLLRSQQKAAYIHYYYHYLSEVDRLEKQKKDAEEELENLKKTGKKIVKDLTYDKKKILEISNGLAEKYYETTPKLESVLPKELKQRVTEIWKKIEPHTIESSDLSAIVIEASDYLSHLENEINKIRNDQVYINANAIERLVSLLEDFESYDLIIPKIKVTISEFINLLKEENKKSKEIVERYNIYNTIYENLKLIKESAIELRRKLEYYKDTQQRVGEFSENFEVKLVQLNNKLSVIEDMLKCAKKKCSHYYTRCISLNIDEEKLQKPYKEIISEIPINEELEEWLRLGEEGVLRRLADLEEKIQTKEERRRDLAIIIDKDQAEVERLEKLEPHKYEKFYNELNDIHIKVYFYAKKILDTYYNALNSLIKNEIKKDEIDNNEEIKKYFEEVWIYLAHKIGEFKHIDRTYKAKAIDLISKRIVTEEGTIIYLIDMGTGQSQSAFLRSLLNASNDGRKIIAFFDEIAMMDDNSLNPIIERMRELYYEKRLLLGILVQKRTDKINIKPLI